MTIALKPNQVVASFDERLSEPLLSLGFQRVGEVAETNGVLELIYEGSAPSVFSPDLSETGSEITFCVTLASGEVTLWGGTAPDILCSATLQRASHAPSARPLRSNSPAEERMVSTLDAIAAMLAEIHDR